MTKELRRARSLRESQRLEELDRAWVVLSISSDNLSPEAITERLGLEPSRSRLKGEPIDKSKCSEFLSSSHSWSYFTDSHLSSKRVEDHLTWLLDNQLYDKRQAIRDLQRDGAEVTIFAWTKAWSSLLFMNLEPVVLRKLAQLNLRIEFTTHFKNAKQRFE
ncbi:MAG: DUF4279 domain-containing protein [Cyanobacteria bacterium HKST-UBA02]|nr:DUF4279 domain-containing protein [Cyanobacteria bacterium HKST-UBA02]